MPKRKATQPAFSRSLRDSIEESGLSAYALGQLAGVSRTTLCMFIDGKRGLTTDTVDKIAPHLGLKVSYPARSKPR